MANSVSSDLLRDLFQHVPCGIHALDPEGTIVEVNDTEADWLGYSREELIGKKLSDLLQPGSRNLFDELFPKFKGTGSLRDIEIELTRKNGSTLPVLVSATAVRDPAGRFLMSRSILYDMTERKQAEETRLRLAAIVNSSDDAIIGENMQRIILSWNPGAEAMFGYRAHEIIGKSFALLVPEERRGEFTEIRARIQRGEYIRHFETERVRKDGRKIHVSMTMSPLNAANGESLGIATIARDVTEQWRQRLQREELITKLKAALTKVRLLSGLLPICASCKKIRDEQGDWQTLELYIRDRSEATFSHGICPECRSKLYPETLP